MNSINPLILVADDDADNMIITTMALRSKSYSIVQAVNGVEVLALAEKEKPDLILLDLSMPKMDGWQVVKQLKSKPELSRIPVIAFTAHAMRGDEEKAREAGCDDYLSKPCTPQMIIKKVGFWLEKIVSGQ